MLFEVSLHICEIVSPDSYSKWADLYCFCRIIFIWIRKICVLYLWVRRSLLLSHFVVLSKEDITSLLS